MIDADRLLEALRSHIGAHNGISADGLVAEVNANAGHTVLTTRELRQLVVALRKQGHHVCAHPRTGYFLAATDTELSTTCGFLRERAVSSLQQVAAMERVSLPDLLGQLHLPT